jgi:CHAD domain-containing protein
VTALDASAPAMLADPATAATAPVAPDLALTGPPPGAIERGDSMATAGRKAMWPQVSRLLSLDADLRDPERPHDLKRYRVATRRLRAALRAFGPAYRKRDVARLRDGLGELASAAGAVRDLDVRIAHVSRWAEDQGGAAVVGIQPLTSAWLGERESAAATLDARLGESGHERLLVDLIAFVEDSSPASEPGDRAIGLRAGSLAWAGYGGLLAHEAEVRDADLPTLHGIRIEAKRLRYLLEFLGDILGSERAGLVAKLVALQDHLGALNDAALTADAVQAFVLSASFGSPADDSTIAAYLEDREREVLRLRIEVSGPWGVVAGRSFARGLAASLVTAALGAPPIREVVDLVSPVGPGVDAREEQALP